jgi:hypothetical protein
VAHYLNFFKIQCHFCYRTLLCAARLRIWFQNDGEPPLVDQNEGLREGLHLTWHYTSIRCLAVLSHTSVLWGHQISQHPHTPPPQKKNSCGITWGTVSTGKNCRAVNLYALCFLLSTGLLC